GDQAEPAAYSPDGLELAKVSLGTDWEARPEKARPAIDWSIAFDSVTGQKVPADPEVKTRAASFTPARPTSAWNRETGMDVSSLEGQAERRFRAIADYKAVKLGKENMVLARLNDAEKEGPFTSAIPEPRVIDATTGKYRISGSAGSAPLIYQRPGFSGDDRLF